jgi:hypothetical protein
MQNAAGSLSPRVKTYRKLSGIESLFDVRRDGHAADKANCDPKDGLFPL